MVRRNTDDRNGENGLEVVVGVIPDSALPFAPASRRDNPHERMPSSYNEEVSHALGLVRGIQFPVPTKARTSYALDGGDFCADDGGNYF